MPTQNNKPIFFFFVNGHKKKNNLQRCENNAIKMGKI